MGPLLLLLLLLGFRVYGSRVYEVSSLAHLILLLEPPQDLYGVRHIPPSHKPLLLLLPSLPLLLPPPPPPTSYFLLIPLNA
jgi:hypothetical protein